MGHLRPTFIFRLFQANITIFTTNQMWKNVHPVYGAGIRNQDLQNMSLLDPITTKPGFSPLIEDFWETSM